MTPALKKANATIAQLENAIKKLEFELNHSQRRNSELTLELERMHKTQNAWLTRICDELVATMRTGAAEANWPRRPDQE